MASTFSLTGKLGLDAKDFVSGAKKAEKSVGDVADELEKLPSKSKKYASDAGSEFADNFKSSVGPAALAGAIGTALYMGIQEVFARQDSTRILVGQFGKTADEAARYGEIAGNLYANAWGDSLQDVTAALGAVDQRLVQTGIIGEDSLEGVTEKALALSDTFETDVSAVVRSVSQLMLNGLAPDSETAMDLVTTALQNGSNAAGDLFESIDEYSQHFAAFGLSAEDMMSMFSDGMANGQRDTDKMADAVKEMFIRTTDGSEATRTAFARIGLSTEEMADKITAGGDDARDAFIDILKRINVIEDPIDRTTTGVALMGTMFEDLGPKGVDSLLAIEQGLGDVEGATEGVVASFGTVENRWQAAQRKIVAGAYEIVAGGDATEYSWKRVEQAFWALEKIGPKTFDELDAAVRPLVASQREADEAIQKYVDSVDDATAANLTSAGAVAIAQAAQENQARSALYAAQETDRLAEEVNALGGEAEDTTSALDDLTAEFEAMKASLSERSAFLNVQDGFDGIKAKALEALAVAGEQTDEAKAKLRDYEQAQIDLKNEVIDYATEVGNIPPEVVSEINALIDEGLFDEAERRLAELERAREARLEVKVTSSGYITLPNGQRIMDSGGHVPAGETAMVAERRPEFVNGVLIHTPTMISGPADVTGGAATAAMFARSAAAAFTPRPVSSGVSGGIANGSGVTINHYGPRLNAGDVSRGYTLARLAQV